MGIVGGGPRGTYSPVVVAKIELIHLEFTLCTGQERTGVQCHGVFDV